MKICWDNIEKMILGKRCGELRKDHYTYIEKEACKVCKELCLANKYVFVALLVES